MKRTQLVTAVVSLMVFAFALNVEAGPRRGHRGHKGKGEMSARLCEKLDLSAEQQTKVKNLREETKSETKALHQKLGELRQEMHWLWSSENPNEDAIMAKKGDVDKLTAKLKEIPVTEMLGGEAKELKADLETLGKSLSALKDRFQVYYDKLKEKGGDLSGLEM